MMQSAAHWRRKLKLYIGILGLMLLCYVFWWEPDSLTVQTYQLDLNNWSAKLQDFDVAVLSDLHIGAPYMGLEKLQEIVDKTNQQQPSLILIAGDFLAYKRFFKSSISIDVVAQVLSGLRAPLGVWAVLGNHDYKMGAAPIKAALSRHYISVLEDSAVLLSANGQALWLAGVSDAWKGKHDIKKALADIPSTDPVMVLTHNPDLFLQMPAFVSLTISGHTHGGQVRFNPFVPTRYGYVKGRYQAQHHDLFVSSGLGTSILPMRLGVPPEISLLHLSPANTAD